MRKLFYILMAMTFTFTACELETSGNGDLDGLWKMQGIDSLASGSFVDMSQRQVAYSVQMNLLQLSGIDIDSSVFCRFEHKGDSLIIYDPRAKDTINSSITNIEVLRPYGITRMPMPFHIDALSGSRMILKSDELRLYFEKY